MVARLLVLAIRDSSNQIGTVSNIVTIGIFQRECLRLLMARINGLLYSHRLPLGVNLEPAELCRD